MGRNVRELLKIIITEKREKKISDIWRKKINGQRE
jgi:hypothetical protein